MSYLSNKKNCLFKKKNSEEPKKLLALEKGKMKKLDQELAKSKETTYSLKSSIGSLQDQHDVLLKTHQDLEVQFVLFGQAPPRLQPTIKPPQIK
jgi:hypothetical protein